MEMKIRATDIGHFLDCQRRGLARLTNAGREAMERPGFAVSATKVCGILAHDYAAALALDSPPDDLDEHIPIKHQSILESPIRYTKDLPNTYTLWKVARRIGQAAADWVRDFAEEHNGQITTEHDMESEHIVGRPDFLVDGFRFYIIDLKVSGRRPDEAGAVRHFYQMSAYAHLVAADKPAIDRDTFEAYVLGVSTKEPDVCVGHRVKIDFNSPMLAAIQMKYLTAKIASGDLPLANANVNPNSIYCNPASCAFYGDAGLCPETCKGDEDDEK